jgi:hypothetical protein
MTAEERRALARLAARTRWAGHTKITATKLAACPGLTRAGQPCKMTPTRDGSGSCLNHSRATAAKRPLWQARRWSAARARKELVRQARQEAREKAQQARQETRARVWVLTYPRDCLVPSFTRNRSCRFCHRFECDLGRLWKYGPGQRRWVCDECLPKAPARIAAPALQSSAPGPTSPPLPDVVEYVVQQRRAHGRGGGRGGPWVPLGRFNDMERAVKFRAQMAREDSQETRIVATAAGKYGGVVRDVPKTEEET